jgi:hypothetical protein
MTAGRGYEPSPAIRFRAAEAQIELERALGTGPPETPRALRLAQLLLASAMIGLFAAGLSVAAILVILNLVFHYSPG